MSGGKKPIVSKGTKDVVECYFATKFPIATLWICPNDIFEKYDEWHAERCKELAKSIEPKIWTLSNKPIAVASKFLNTFMHQLMKYEAVRPLWLTLHLPLDSRVFRALKNLKSPALKAVRKELTKSPYQLSYCEYLRVQQALTSLIEELNRRTDAEFQVKSRIELNWLWVL
jgi:hypothetical protein